MTILSSVVLLGGEVSSVQVSQTPVSAPGCLILPVLFLSGFVFPRVFMNFPPLFHEETYAFPITSLRSSCFLIVPFRSKSLPSSPPFDSSDFLFQFGLTVSRACRTTALQVYL